MDAERAFGATSLRLSGTTCIMAPLRMSVAAQRISLRIFFEAALSDKFGNFMAVRLWP